MDMSFLLLLLVGGLWETDAESVTGLEGDTVRIKCSHSYADTNTKYFCRDPCGYADVLIRSKEKKRKYSIEDKGNTFYVTITDLTGSDTGLYYCGIDRVGADTYNRIYLTVKKAHHDGGDHGIMSDSGLLVYIGAGLGVLVLALAMVVLIFLRHRRRGTRSADAQAAKGQSTVYAAVSGGKQSAPESTTAPEAQPYDVIYELPSKPVHQNNGEGEDNTLSQSDGLVYSTVHFIKDSGGVAPLPSPVTYSAITPTPSDASTAYSNL